MPAFHVRSKLLRTLPVMVLLVYPFIVLQAQLAIQFMPAINGQSVNGLFTAQVQNSTLVAYNGRVKISVRNAGNKILLLAQTGLLTIYPGMNSLQGAALTARLQFGNSAESVIMSQTGRFPENDYEYCFEFTGTEIKNSVSEKVFENCFNYSLHPMVPLSLVYPGDGERLCDTRPTLTWQPALPPVGTYRYRVLLVEKNDQQAETDALISNLPIIQQENISGFLLPYPRQAPALQQGKKYVWQVAACEGNTIVTRSEIWQFTISCNEKKPDSSSDSYRQVSGSLNGNYYLSGDTIRLSLYNAYTATELQYAITDIAEPLKNITNLPTVNVQTGLNKLNISTEDITGLQAGRMYLLKIQNIGDHALYLQFLYKQNDTKQ